MTIWIGFRSLQQQGSSPVSATSLSVRPGLAGYLWATTRLHSPPKLPIRCGGPCATTSIGCVSERSQHATPLVAPHLTRRHPVPTRRGLSEASLPSKVNLDQPHVSDPCPHDPSKVSEPLKTAWVSLMHHRRSQLDGSWLPVPDSTRSQSRNRSVMTRTKPLVPLREHRARLQCDRQGCGRRSRRLRSAPTPRPGATCVTVGAVALAGWCGS